MKFVTALLIVLATLAPARAELKSFRDWVAGCDNTRSCSAYALRDNEANSAFLRLDRDGAADAKPRFTIIVHPENAKAVTLAFDDASVGGLPKGKTTLKIDDDEFARIAIPEGDTEAVLAAIRKAGKIIVTDPDAAKKDDKLVGEISLSGAAAALLWLDEQQKRLGTATALIRRGAKPASLVPAPPAVPVVKAAKLEGAATKDVPPAVRKRGFAVCQEGDDDKDDANVEQGEPNRLGGSQTLYWFSCRSKSGAYNIWNALLVAPRDKPAAVRSVKLPLPPGEKSRDEFPDGFIINGNFDEDTQTLSMFSKGRGIGDCGSMTEWVFDGKDFVITRFQEMTACGGLVSNEWLTTYRADVKR